MDIPTLGTDRLLLRGWRAEDREPFSALNADPVVMDQYPTTLTGEESDAFVDRIERLWDERGWGLWAVAVVDGPSFIGYVGFAPAEFAADFTPAVEIGWRLAAEHWNQGYATEAARAAVVFGYESLGFTDIVSFTAVTNVRSQRVMQKLGMTRDPAEDFDHPNLPPDHRLQPHVLYRLSGDPLST